MGHNNSIQLCNISINFFAETLVLFFFIVRSVMSIHQTCVPPGYVLYEVKWSEVAQSCPTLWHPMDCSLPGSSVHGIFQARILEWVAMPSSRGIFQSQRSSPSLPLCRRILSHLNHQESPLIASYNLGKVDLISVCLKIYEYNITSSLT